MEPSTELPPNVRKLQKSVEVFVRSRKDAALIRRVLFSHLKSHVNFEGGNSLPIPLSLLDASYVIAPPEHGFKGLQKEYLRCAQENIKAKDNFKTISNKQSEKNEKGTSTGQHLSSMDGYLELLKLRQKHDRLRIVQDYIDMLCQKPAATPEHLDAKLVLQDVESLPKVPNEILNASSNSQSLPGGNLTVLADQLEKSVLRAKMLLKNEQSLLKQVKAKRNASQYSMGSRLQALGSTRNELISWIETELSQAGDDSSTVHDEEMGRAGGGGKEYMDTQLAFIHRQYSRYTKSRQRLILAATGRLETPEIQALENTTFLTDSRDNYNPTQAQIAFPYLEKMVAISNDQKAMIQQKSYLTTTLSKQLLETNLGLDRLAEESHLLPSHPMPATVSVSKRLKTQGSFGEDLLHHEKPDASHRAAAWVFAADLAGRATDNSLSRTLEDGVLLVKEARGTLEDLKKLLGSTAGAEASNSGDIWTVLDGTLGVIKADAVD